MSGNRNPSPKYGSNGDLQIGPSPPSPPPQQHGGGAAVAAASSGYASLLHMPKPRDDRITPPRMMAAGSQRLQNISPHSPSVSPLYRQSSPSTAISSNSSSSPSSALPSSSSSASSASSSIAANKSPGSSAFVHGGIAVLRPGATSTRNGTPTQRNATPTERKMSSSASRALKLANTVREVNDPKLLTTKQNGEPRHISRRKQRKHDNKELKHVFQVLSAKGYGSGERGDIEGSRWIEEIMGMDRTQLLGIISSNEVNFSTVLGALFDDKSNEDILHSFRKCEDAKFGIATSKQSSRRGKYRRTQGIVVQGEDRIENSEGVDLTERSWMNMERKLRHMIIDLIKQNPASMLEIICIIETIIFQFYRVTFLGEDDSSSSSSSSSSSGGVSQDASSSTCDAIPGPGPQEAEPAPDVVAVVDASGISQRKLAMECYGNPESTAYMILSTDHPEDPHNSIRVSTKCPRNRVLFHGICQFYSIHSETITDNIGDKIVLMHFRDKTKSIATLKHQILLSNALLQWVRKNKSIS